MTDLSSIVRVAAIADTHLRASSMERRDALSWLGEVADRTGSIWPAIVCHVFNNAVATIMAGVFGIDHRADPAEARLRRARGTR